MRFGDIKVKEKESRITPEFMAWKWVGELPFRYGKQEVVPGERVEENESTFFFF